LSQHSTDIHLAPGSALSDARTPHRYVWRKFVPTVRGNQIDARIKFHIHRTLLEQTDL